MQQTTKLLARARAAPLVPQFLAAGGAVMLAAMLIIGAWITQRIEQSVVDNSAAATALYVESFVSPLSQELAASDALSTPALMALEEVFAKAGLAERIVSFRIWKPGGRIVYATDPEIVGRTFEPSEDLRRAWSGRVSASFGGLGDAESAREAELGVPLLEVYSPIREVWSGDVIAVAEFYEAAHELQRDLADARRASWLLVAGVFLASGLMLLGIVRAGGRTIERQRALLSAQVAESRKVAEQNRELRNRAVSASARAAAQAEKSLRRVSADLHDGPAQYVALAAMRIESLLPDDGTGTGEAAAIRGALQTALAEIRSISRGLSLPDLERLSLAEVAERAVEAHRPHAAAEISLEIAGAEDAPVGASARICLYRFLQEALSNAARHAPGASVAVTLEAGPNAVRATVRDEGPGFDPVNSTGVRADGGEGLAGLRDRAESIGGELGVTSAPGDGATLVLTLPVKTSETP